MIELTQQEVVSAILRAAAEKAGVSPDRLGRISSFGKAWTIDDEGKKLLLIERCEVEDSRIG